MTADEWTMGRHLEGVSGNAGAGLRSSALERLLSVL
jgi:hypothetical protein